MDAPIREARAHVADQFTNGQVVNDKYRIVATVGRGGMGNVYQAEQLPLGRRVALKVLRGRPGTNEIDPAFQRRFFLEASLCSKLSHPNIITVFDYGEVRGLEGACFIAMEFLAGETLHARLKARGGALEPGEAVVVALQIARGLREAHRNGLVHRDLKPANVMLVPDEELGERCKILDFGLVKQVEGADKEDITREGSFLGSPKYMAPEQIEGHGVDARTDLYALGVILYQCLAGRPPFEGETPMRVFVGHLTHPVPRIADANPRAAVPEPLEAFVRRLLEKSSAARPASADEVVHALRALQESLGLARTLRKGPSPTDHAIAAAAVRAQIAAAQSIAPAGSPSVLPRPAPVATDPSLSLSLPGASMPRRINSLAAPPSPRPHRTSMLLVGVGVFALLGAGGVVATRLAGRHAQPTRDAQPAVVRSPARAPDAPLAHQLAIESVPAGAWVRENGAVLGATPLVITLDPGQPAARTFVVQADGYLPYTIVRPPTQLDAHVRAELARPSSDADNAVARPSAPRHRAATSAGPHTASTTGAALGIRMSR